MYAVMQTIRQLYWVRQIRYLISTVYFIFVTPFYINSSIQYSLYEIVDDSRAHHRTIYQDKIVVEYLLSVPRPHSNNSKYWMIRSDHHLQLHSLKDWSHEISPPTPFHILLYFYCCSLVLWISHLFLLICPRWLQFYSFGSLHKPIHTLLSNMFTHIHLYPMIPRHLLPPSLLCYHTRSIGFSSPLCCWIIETLQWI